MKVLPPELIDGIIYILTAAVGWFTRWLQTRKKLQELETDNTILAKELTLEIDAHRKLNEKFKNLKNENESRKEA